MSAPTHPHGRHRENPAARTLEARWRRANELTDHGKVFRRNLSERLVEHPLVLDNEEMQRLGGEEHGYEQVRQPTSSAVDFMHRFPLDMCFPIDSTEHTEWLAAAGTI